MSQAGSDKHGPRLDDELDEDTAALTHGAPEEGRTERRRQQAAAEGEPDATVDRSEVAMPPAAIGDEPPTERARAARAELAAALGPSAFPATAADLAAAARDAHVSGELAAALDRIDGGRRFDTVGELWDALEPIAGDLEG